MLSERKNSHAEIIIFSQHVADQEATVENS